MLYEVITNFQEALQKACQSLEIKRNGLGADAKELRDRDQIMQSLQNPSWNRLFHIYDAFKLGIPFNRITSYNVCYTKLLRPGRHGAGGRDVRG